MIPPTLVQPSFRSKKPQNFAHLLPTFVFILVIFLQISAPKSKCSKPSYLFKNQTNNTLHTILHHLENLALQKYKFF
jgi:hypothetical protein